MTIANETLMRQLKAARKRQGLNQQRLSELSGLPQSRISKIENNEIDCRVSTLITIAHSVKHEVVLVPVQALPAVKAVIKELMADATHTSNSTAQSGEPLTPQPAYRIDDDDGDDDDDDQRQ